MKKIAGIIFVFTETREYDNVQMLFALGAGSKSN